jgi:hypothetical protein
MKIANSAALIGEFGQLPESTREWARELEGCAVTLAIDDGAIQIASIEALEPGRGAGTRAMRKLCELADQHQVELTLIADPFKSDSGRPIITRAKLMHWYHGFGFRACSVHSYQMRRPPVLACEACGAPENDGKLHSIPSNYREQCNHIMGR